MKYAICFLFGMFIMTPTHVSPEQAWANLKAWEKVLINEN